MKKRRGRTYPFILSSLVLFLESTTSMVVLRERFIGARPLPQCCTCAERRDVLCMKDSRDKKPKKESTNNNSKDPQDKKALRVDPKINIPVRKQIQWVQLKKDYAAKESQSYRKEKTKFRKIKGEDPEYVDEIDLSEVRVTKVLPALIVDGYNIIYFMPKMKKRMVRGDLEQARDMLCTELAEMSSMRGWDTKVVFDAHNTDAVDASRHKHGGVEVIFTSAQQTADMYIEKETQRLKQNECPSIMVATGDGVIRTIAGAHGAEIMSPTKLVQEMKIARKEALSIAETKVENKGGAGLGLNGGFRLIDSISQKERDLLMQLRNEFLEEEMKNKKNEGKK